MMLGELGAEDPVFCFFAGRSPSSLPLGSSLPVSCEYFSKVWSQTGMPEGLISGHDSEASRHV